MKQKIHILIIEDEKPIRDMVKFALSDTNFEIKEAANVREAKLRIADQIPDLILLDWMLPDISGIDFAKQLKQEKDWKNIRIIMLTARAEEENKIKGFEIGIDDYITKPFSPRELIARIRAILRRGVLVAMDGIIKIHSLCLNINNHTLKINDHSIPLTTIEYKLLHFFMTHPNRIYSREQLLNYVWGGQQYVNDRTVDVQIRRLRNRLHPYQGNGYIKTIRGYGYQFIGVSE